MTLTAANSNCFMCFVTQSKSHTCIMMDSQNPVDYLIDPFYSILAFSFYGSSRYKIRYLRHASVHCNWHKKKSSCSYIMWRSSPAGTEPVHFVKDVRSLTFCEARPEQSSNSVELNPFALVQIFFLTGRPLGSISDWFVMQRIAGLCTTHWL